MPNKNTIHRGVIRKGVGGRYNVLLSSGELVECTVRGKLKLGDESIVVGDKVLVDRSKKTIESILARDNMLLRPVVANVEAALIVFSSATPSLSYNLLDKILITCEYEFVEPIICINKIDLADVNLDRYSMSGYKIFRVSAKNNIGFDDLVKTISGKTVVLAGPSGVGKSSIINAITGMVLKTGDVSDAANRGKHTTRHTEFFDLPSGGILVDAPGFGALDLDYIKREEVWELYPEFRVYRGCKFNNCLHLDEPECAIRKAAESGNFPMERYISYQKIMEEL